MALHGIDEFHISQGSWLLFDLTRYAIVSLSAETGWPVNDSVLAHFRVPLGADLGQIICPAKRRAAAVRTMNNDDLLRRQLGTWVRLHDRGVIPHRDLA